MPSKLVPGGTKGIGGTTNADVTFSKFISGRSWHARPDVFVVNLHVASRLNKGRLAGFSARLLVEQATLAMRSAVDGTA